MHGVCTSQGSRSHLGQADVADFPLSTETSAKTPYISSPDIGNALLEFDHLGHNMLDGCRTIETVGVPQVNRLHIEPFQALLASNRHIFCISVEFKATPGVKNPAELRREEDIFAFFGIL